MPAISPAGPMRHDEAVIMVAGQLIAFLAAAPA